MYALCLNFEAINRKIAIQIILKLIMFDFIKFSVSSMSILLLIGASEFWDFV